jgi:hypothetical protein
MADLVEDIKLQIATESRMSPVGVNQLLDGQLITSADDRKRLVGYLFYLHGRLRGCPLPPTPTKSSLHDIH